MCRLQIFVNNYHCYFIILLYTVSQDLTNQFALVWENNPKSFCTSRLPSRLPYALVCVPYSLCKCSQDSHGYERIPYSHCS